jgi:hypothetical protein
VLLLLSLLLQRCVTGERCHETGRTETTLTKQLEGLHTGFDATCSGFGALAVL